jgi:exopolysaccharide biosynthesis polyprenyl glycosylphosphotransferase
LTNIESQFPKPSREIVIESGQPPQVAPELIPAMGVDRLDDAFAVRASVGWKRRYVAALVFSDVIVGLLAATLSRVLGLDGMRPQPSLTYFGVAGWLIIFLLMALASAGCYELRHLASPVEEYRRLLRASAVMIGLLAVVAVLADFDLHRRVLLIDVPLGLLLLAVGRTLVRRMVNIQRCRGAWTERVLAVGSASAVRDLIRTLHRRPLTGLTVVAACVPEASTDGGHELDVPVLGGWDDAVVVADAVDADVVALAGVGRGPQAVRELAWQLEGSGRHLVTALELAEISSSRIHLRPVDGVPLAWVDHPEFTGIRRTVKRGTDITLAGLALLVATPLLLVIAGLIKATSRGPVLFKQTRSGKDGEPIRVLKFRTMVADAEEKQRHLLELNEAGNLLYFKIRDDPRITPVGRWLRRFSLDELPQLINVLSGSMSLVGPRPLPGEVEPDAMAYHRRLRVKPGLTGLWQVSGRSNLSTDEALRLDLYYVENWTLGLDLAIIARTAWAVLRSRGAY